MKTQFLTLGIIAVALLATVGTVMAKTTTLTVPSYETQFQWRALGAYPGGVYGAWSYFQPSYLTSTDYTPTGNVLHTTISYAPYVSNQQGGELTYTYDKSTDTWILHDGTVSYNYAPSYGSYTVTNYFRGYIQFSGTPSATNFKHGVLYQWVYIFAPETDTGVKAILPNAQWDSKVGAWLIGFSLYIDDSSLQTYSMSSRPFPNTVETVTVPAIQDTPTYSTKVLQNGVQYELVASGTANAGDNIEFDAMCSYRTGSSTIWTDSVSTYESWGPQLLDLYVNGVDSSWGTACSPSNTYSMPITGTGTTVSFQVYDIYYPNNVDFLTVNILGPFIEPVPANNFNPLGL